MSDVNQEHERILLSTEWNSVRLVGPAHGMLTKNVYKNVKGKRVSSGEGTAGVKGW